MKRVGLREANQQFSRLVRAVRSGEEVLILDRGKPVAMVKPVVPPASSTKRAIERLTARGLLLPASRPALVPRFRPVRARLGLGKAVLADRKDRG
jgi:prevent-host-death family protein